MASTNFIPGTVITSEWLNEVDEGIFETLPTLALKLYGDAVFVGTGGDDSVAVQAFVDANKGKTLIIKSATFAGLLLSGSTYNNTKLYVQNHTLSTRPNASTNNWAGAAWVGLALQSCDNITLDYNGSGNRTAQPDEEHCHNVVIAGCSNVLIPRFSVREVRGDGLYMCQSNPFASSTTNTNVNIGAFSAYNVAADGRNALSVIACSGMSIGSFLSSNVGGTVGGIGQPGGFDIEPNYPYQIVEDVSVGAMTVSAPAGSCISLAGQTISGGYNIRRVNLGAISSVNTRGASATQGTYALLLLRCQDVTVRGSATHTLASNGVAVYIDNAKRISTDINVAQAEIGVILGLASFVTESPNLRFTVSSYATAGIRSVGVTYSRVLGRVWGATSGSSTFAVQVRANSRSVTQSRVIYSVDTPYDGTNARGYVHGNGSGGDLVTFTNSAIQDCSVDGYASWTVAIDGFGVAGIRKRDIIGITDVLAMPSDGGWTQGDFVNKSNPSKDGNNMTILGWTRLTTGTGNVSGTDWAICYVSHVSPAA